MLNLVLQIITAYFIPKKFIRKSVRIIFLINCWHAGRQISTHILFQKKKKLEKEYG